MKSNLLWLRCTVLVCLFAAETLYAEDVINIARSVADKSSKAIVTVKVVLKLKQNMGGQTREQDQKFEVTGTVIDPSGLTVSSSNGIDPTAQIKSSGMPIECEVKETTLLLDDGTEVDADIVLKDTDLDLAFIKPKEADRKFDAVSMDGHAGALLPLDSVFVVSRLGKLGNRGVALTLGAVKAYVKGPKPYYVCDGDVSNNLGCLGYAADGKPVGLFVVKVSQEPAASRGREMMIAILRPLADVLKIAEEAKQAKPVKAEDKKEGNPEAKKAEDTKSEGKKD